MASEMDIILCIPGDWSDVNDFARSFRKGVSPREYVFGGQIVMDSKTEDKFRLEFKGPDPQLAEAFYLTSGGRISEETLQKINSHKSIAYIIGSGGSVENSRKILTAGDKLIKSGGMGVKVETSGKSHCGSDWSRFASCQGPESLCEAFVTLIGSRRTIHSCGMHNFGEPDVIMDHDNQQEETGEIIELFILERLGDSVPENLSESSRELLKNMPRCSVRREECREYSPDELFFNPFGMLRLVR